MVRSNLRLAAGAGITATFLLVGVPATAAFAHPSGSHGSDRGGSDRDWGGGSKRGSDHRDGDYGSRRGADGPRSDTDNGPRTRVGSGRDVAQLSPGGSADSSNRSGSDHSRASTPQFEPPKVTVGNGRSPGIQHHDRAPRRPVIAPEPAPPPPPPVITPPAPSWVDRIYLPRPMPKQLGVKPAAGQTDPLWGIAGLLLIPAAGAVLGYRQARAAQAAAELGRA